MKEGLFGRDVSDYLRVSGCSLSVMVLPERHSLEAGGPHPHPRDNNPCPVVRRQIKPHPSVDTFRTSNSLLYQTACLKTPLDHPVLVYLTIMTSRMYTRPLCYTTDISDTMGGNFVYFFFLMQ